jgi:hypothetical protein
MWIDPSNSNHVITGCDGGVNVSWDKGATWDFIDNLNIGQFYHVGYDMSSPYRVYGGLQDNSSWGGPSAVRGRLGIGNFDWMLVGTGDGFVSLVDPKDPRTIYAESQGGNMNRVDRASGEWKGIKPQPAKGEPPLRWNWDTPIVLSPFSSSTIFVAANKVFKSTDRGHSWKAISPDLTAQIDREQLSLMGVPAKNITIAKNDGVSSYGVIVTFAESPKRAGLYYSGADDGTLQVSRDDGAHWENITTRVPGLPKNTYVSRLTPSAFDEGTVYATFNNHREDDDAPYVYASADRGQTWRSISSDLPKGQAVNCITEDIRNPNVLYVGTEFGLFISLDKGGHWARLKANLPTVPIDEITIQSRDNDMILATHGRGIWILDDLTPLQRAAEAMAAAAYLFETRQAMAYNVFQFRTDFGGPGDRRFWGANPTFGAGIAYYLRQSPATATLAIRDGAGAPIRNISIAKGEATPGLHRVYWDLRHEPLPPPRIAAAGGGGGAATLDAPFVLPGEYQISLVVDGRSVATRAVHVIADSVMPMTDADRRVLHSTLLGLHALQQQADDAADAVGTLSEQVASVQNVLRTSRPSAAVAATVDSLGRQLATLRRQLAVPAPGARAGGPGGGGFGGAEPPVRTRIAGVKREIMASTSLPTETQSRVAREGRADLAKVIEEVNSLINVGMPALSRLLAGNGVTVPGFAALRPLAPVRAPPQ